MSDMIIKTCFAWAFIFHMSLDFGTTSLHMLISLFTKDGVQNHCTLRGKGLMNIGFFGCLSHDSLYGVQCLRRKFLCICR